MVGELCIYIVSRILMASGPLGNLHSQEGGKGGGEHG